MTPKAQPELRPLKLASAQAWCRECWCVPRSRYPSRRQICSTRSGNIAFIVTRLMLLLGQFNYGKRGILDVMHTCLFTFALLRRLFEQAASR